MISTIALLLSLASAAPLPDQTNSFFLTGNQASTGSMTSLASISGNMGTGNQVNTINNSANKAGGSITSQNSIFGNQATGSQANSLTSNSNDAGTTLAAMNQLSQNTAGTFQTNSIANDHNWSKGDQLNLNLLSSNIAASGAQTNTATVSDNHTWKKQVNGCTVNLIVANV